MVIWSYDDNGKAFFDNIILYDNIELYLLSYGYICSNFLMKIWILKLLRWCWKRYRSAYLVVLWNL